MKSLAQLRDMGQSIWLDNITRELLTSGTLARYIDEFGVTGLTSNPTIFERAISGSADYDDSIKQHLGRGLSAEDLFFDLAIEDLRIAAQHFHGIFEATNGRDGFVSLEVSPALADDADRTVEAAVRLHAQAGCENLFIKVPGTAAGVAAIEELIFRGIPVNVTLLFSTRQCVAAAEAFFRGVERRREAGRELRVASVASLFISRWDAAVASRVPEILQDRTGIAIGQQTQRAFQELYASERWVRLAKDGAYPQRLLWASTGTKNPALPAGYYVEALAAEGTINTVPEKTLLAIGGETTGGETNAVAPTSSSADEFLADLARLGIDIDRLAGELQRDGRDAFVADFDRLIRGIVDKVSALKQR